LTIDDWRVRFLMLGVSDIVRSSSTVVSTSLNHRINWFSSRIHITMIHQNGGWA